VKIKKIVLFLAMIPFFTSSLTIDYFPEADATKSKGKHINEEMLSCSRKMIEFEKNKTDGTGTE